MLSGFVYRVPEDLKAGGVRATGRGTAVALETGAPAARAWSIRERTGVELAVDAGGEVWCFLPGRTKHCWWRRADVRAGPRRGGCVAGV